MGYATRTSGSSSLYCSIRYQRTIIPHLSQGRFVTNARNRNDRSDHTVHRLNVKPSLSVPLTWDWYFLHEKLCDITQRMSPITGWFWRRWSHYISWQRSPWIPIHNAVMESLSATPVTLPSLPSDLPRLDNTMGAWLIGTFVATL